MDCSICMNKICNKCNLNCNHNFCYKCIENWSELSSTCPICRSYFSMNQVNKNTRLTRSMSKKSRQDKLLNHLNNLLYEINNFNDNIDGNVKNQKISQIFNIFYINDWLFTCTENMPTNICNCTGCICRRVVTQKIDEFSKLKWSGIKIWEFKFRKYMEN